MESKKVFIYSLSHPVTKEIRYIGKANDINKRLVSHLIDAKTRNTPIYNWINKLKREELIPIIEVVYVSNEFEWCNDEVRLISEYKGNGFNLLNLAEGGNQPSSTYEVKAMNGRNNAKLIHSDPIRKRMWYLKKELGSHFKRVGDTPRVLEMKQKLNSLGIYL